MNAPKTERRYQKVMREFKGTALGRALLSVKRYTEKAWTSGKKIIWGVSIAGILIMLPMGIELIMDTEARVSSLNSQLNGEINPNVELRPY